MTEIQQATPAKKMMMVFDSPQRKRIYQLLGEIVGPGPAALYHDACRLLSEKEPYLTTVHLVGHLYREIESSVLGVIVPKHAYAFNDSKNNHAKRIHAAGVILGIEPDDEFLRIWEEMELHGLAHRKNLSERQIDDAFVRLCEHMDALLYVVLTRFSDRFKICIERVSELLSKDQPGKVDIQALREGIPNHRMMFEHLFSLEISSRWIDALLGNEFFADMPENALVPALDYALFHAEKKSKIAIAIASGIVSLSNLEVANKFIQLAAKLPTEKALCLLPIIVRWINDDQSFPTGMEFILAVPLSKLCERFAVDGQWEAIDTIMNSITAFRKFIGAEYDEEVLGA